MSGLQTLLLTLLYLTFLASSSTVSNPEAVEDEVQRTLNSSQKPLDSIACGTGNSIDDCWSCDPNWDKNRMKLADCAIGFGKYAMGGKNGNYYVVTNSGQDDPANPRPGTLRHAVVQKEPLWIIFSGDMTIYLKQELIVSSHKTIDGRGANVHIAGGACIAVQFVTNVIIHGLNIHDCKPTLRAAIPTKYDLASTTDGDGISIMASRNIWIDHNSLSRCTDGLVDVTHGSTAITISNNYFFNHNKVMLLGHSDSSTQDTNMQVTVALNRFGNGLTQRMPRCRLGYFHIVNNDYIRWGMYAIGGSANPTINSEGNRFLASDNIFTKEITKREEAAENVWKWWNWRSAGDIMWNGATFTASGSPWASAYVKATSLSSKTASLVGTMTMNAGQLTCRKGLRC